MSNEFLFFILKVIIKMVPYVGFLTEKTFIVRIPSSRSSANHSINKTSILNLILIIGNKKIIIKDFLYDFIFQNNFILIIRKICREFKFFSVLMYSVFEIFNKKSRNIIKSII